MSPFLFFPLLLLLVHSKETVNSDFIPWSDSRKLTWNDFQARPDKFSMEAAVTFSGIHFNYSSIGDSISMTAVATFNKKKSWVKIESANEYILIHEQKHFDITEWYARKLRVALRKISPGHSKPHRLAEDLYRKYSSECRSMQNRYDHETAHSRNEKLQEKWNKIIEKELLSLSFETDSVIVHVK